MKLKNFFFILTLFLLDIGYGSDNKKWGLKNLVTAVAYGCFGYATYSLIKEWKKEARLKKEEEKLLKEREELRKEWKELNVLAKKTVSMSFNKVREMILFHGIHFTAEENALPKDKFDLLAELKVEQRDLRLSGLLCEILKEYLNKYSSRVFEQNFIDFKNIFGMEELSLGQRAQRTPLSDSIFNMADAKHFQHKKFWWMQQHFNSKYSDPRIPLMWNLLVKERKLKISCGLAG